MLLTMGDSFDIIDLTCYNKFLADQAEMPV